MDDMRLIRERRESENIILHSSDVEKGRLTPQGVLRISRALVRNGFASDSRLASDLDAHERETYGSESEEDAMLYSIESCYVKNGYIVAFVVDSGHLYTLWSGTRDDMTDVGDGPVQPGDTFVISDTVYYLQKKVVGQEISMRRCFSTQKFIDKILSVYGNLEGIDIEVVKTGFIQLTSTRTGAYITLESLGDSKTLQLSYSNDPHVVMIFKTQNAYVKATDLGLEIYEGRDKNVFYLMLKR